MFRLDGKVAVITGAGGMICSRLASDLAGVGASVALLDLSLERAQSAADLVSKNGGVSIAVEADVLSSESIERAKETVLSKFGKIDFLINGAGGNHPKSTTGPEQSFFDLPADAIKWVFDLNFIGTVLPTQVFGRLMAEQKSGGIINIASMASFRPLTKVLAYSASKAAIVNYTRWMAVHFCQNYSPEIRVNAIAPGFLLTEQNRFLLQNEDGSLTARGSSVIGSTPMARFGNPEEMSGAVIYLCSDAAAFVTGIVLPIDGGFDAFSGV
ncbi:MAG: SDR family oxidoreductase [Oscillospiraceae bacterium]|jgi:NAD(P)-dependent dehydrogenase (short-subunit alcohol dehydrogenase family)|nr:SDR family oxidoreductase [Oscillospiraceae bacterium]